MRHGIYTGELGQRLYQKLIGTAHAVYFDHKHGAGSESKNRHAMPFFDDCSTASILSYVDLAIINKSSNSVELLAEIEESGVDPKKVIGDIVNILLSDGLRVDGVNYPCGEVVFILGLKVNPRGNTEEKVKRLWQKLARLNEEREKGKIRFIPIFDQNLEALISKVESEIVSQLGVA